MIAVRRSDERGHFDHGWLNTFHTFSFADYYDPKHVHFRALRVINEDTVQAGRGFGMHPHRDMEIITYVLDGEIEHRDSMGNSLRIARGEVQRMTAGTGIQHSEFNPSAEEPLHLFQVWIFPEKKGLTPAYEQRQYDDREKLNGLRLIVSPDGREKSLTIHQDAEVYASLLQAGEGVKHALRAGRGAWLQLASGQISIDGTVLNAGDGASVTGKSAIEIRGIGPNSELLLFDLA